MEEFKNLLEIECKVEEKNKLKYISWANAWEALKKKVPNASYKKHIGENGFLFKSGTGGMVLVDVTVGENTYTADLAITDFRNQPIKYENITSKDIQDTLQRAFTKAIAMHGVGLYVYRGEDIPKLPDFGEDDFKRLQESEKETTLETIKKYYEVSKEWEKKIKNIL